MDKSLQVSYRSTTLNKLLAPSIQGNSLMVTLVHFDPLSLQLEQASQLLDFTSQLPSRALCPTINSDNQRSLEASFRAELLTYRRMAMVVRDFVPNEANSDTEQSSAIILRLHQETTRLQEEKADLQRRLVDLESLKLKVASEEGGHVTDEETKRELTNLRYKIRILTEVETDFKRRLKEMESDHYDVLMELSSLSKNYNGLRASHQNEIRRNEMLGLELLGIVKVKVRPFTFGWFGLSFDIVQNQK